MFEIVVDDTPPSFFSRLPPAETERWKKLVTPKEEAVTEERTPKEIYEKQWTLLVLGQTSETISTDTNLWVE